MNTITLHPVVVHFPIALLMIGFLFAAIYLIWGNNPRCGANNMNAVNKTAFWLLLIGSISAVAAISIGFAFTSKMIGPLGELRDDHILFALSTCAVAIMACIFYCLFISKPEKKAFFYVAFVFYLICAILVGITGHYGGLMVY